MNIRTKATSFHALRLKRGSTPQHNFIRSNSCINIKEIPTKIIPKESVNNSRTSSSFYVNQIETKLSKTLTSFATKKNNIKNKELVEEFSNYINGKQKEFDSLKRFKAPRQEVIKKMLNETKSEQNLFNKTFSSNFIGTQDYTNLNMYYKAGHRLEKQMDDDDDYEAKIAKETLFKKYDLKQSLSGLDKTKLGLKINKKDGQETIEINDVQFYKNQYESYSSLQLNRNLHDQLLVKLNEEQIKAYLGKHFQVEEEKLKIGLMPKIKPLPISHRKKSHSSSSYEQNFVARPIINKLSDIATLSRKTLFNEYHSLYISYISDFLTTPTTRTEAQLIQYVDEKNGEHKLLLYGGMNLLRLGEMWECYLSHLDKHTHQKYKWKKITDISGDIPLPRSGHTACLYRNDVVIYGGVIEDEKAYHYKEDILIYNIFERKFTSDICTNKLNVIWRKNHIAEIIGQFMFIYGGIDEEGRVLNDPWALDLYRMKWIQTKFTNGAYLPKIYYHSSAQVFPPQKKYHPKFSLFKIFSKVGAFNSNIQYEGIYLFGGQNEYGHCTNDVYVIQRGKPLSIVKPDIQGEGPKPRCQCSMNFFEKLNVLIIHGGRNEYEPTGPFFNDFFFLDVERMLWIRLDYNDIDVSPRGGHSAGIIDNDLVIFGGFNDKHFLKSDLMVCNLDIIESSNHIKRVRARKERKKLRDKEDKDKEEADKNDISEKSTITANKDKDTNKENTIAKALNLKESPFVLINSQIQSSKSFFEKFPYQKQMLRQRFEEVEKISFNNENTNGDRRNRSIRSGRSYKGSFV